MVSLQFLFPIILFLTLVFFPSTSSEEIKPTELIDSVCKQVSNYTFCVETIYSYSPNIPRTDLGSLARILFGKSLDQVTATEAQITELRKNPTLRKDPRLIKGLLHCRSDYRQAYRVLEGAFDFLDSEYYDWLSPFVKRLIHKAADCEDGFRKIGRASPLTKMNKYLKDVCDINTVVCKRLE